MAVRGPSDVTAPTLTFPVALPLGDTTAYLGVTTNEGNGTLYYVITTSVTPPSAAQVKAGQDNTGAAAPYAGNQAVSATGAQVASGSGLTSNTAYYGYFMQEDAAGNQSAVKAQTTFTTLTTGTSDTSFDNLIAAMSVAPATLRQGYIAQMIQALYASGTWAKTDVLWNMAAHDEQAARLNWITPASFTLTAVNSPTFTTDRGYNGNNTTSYLDTGWDPATNGVVITQNSAHISIYQRTNAGNTVEAFAQITTGNMRILARGGTNDQARTNSSTTVQTGTTGTLPLQLMGRRSVSTDATVVRDGVQVATGAATSSALSSSDMTFGRSNTSYTSSQVAGGAIGAYLDDTEAAAYYAAWRAYMVAVGADT